MEYLGFDWDDINKRKLAAHGLDPEEIEDLFDIGRPVFVRHPTRRQRLIALGFVPIERIVLVVFEVHAETRWVRVVTAYEAEHERWWQIYRRKREREPAW